MLSTSILLTATFDFVDNLGRRVISFFFPKRCVGCGKSGTWLCQSCSFKLSYVSHQKCLVCGEPAIGGFTHPYCETRYNPDRFLAPFEYRDLLKAAVCKAKYCGSWALFSDLAPLSSRWLESLGIRFLPGAALIPMPLYFIREWERGYNQSLILAEFLSKDLDLPLETDLIYRNRYTPSQTKLSRKARRTNIKGAFTAFPKVRGKNLVLVDDICTSGATLLEAARTLKRQGARTVWCLALARVV